MANMEALGNAAGQSRLPGMSCSCAESWNPAYLVGHPLHKHNQGIPHEEVPAEFGFTPDNIKNRKDRV
jgi:hypothetical protein